MDDSVKKYKERRAERLNKGKEIRVDAAEEYKERKKKRLLRRLENDIRMDAGIGWAYGLAKSEGIDTEGMSPKEVFEALAEKGVKTGNGPSGKKEESGKGENAGGANKNEAGRGSLYTRTFKTSAGVKYPTPKKGAVYDEDTLREVNRLADDKEGNYPPNTEKQGKVISQLTSKDLTYQKDPDGTVVASIPGLSQMYDKRLKGKGPEVQAAYDKRIEGGKKIVSDMVSISDRLGSRMMWLENCFKGGASTARKIDKVKKKWLAEHGIELSDGQALAQMDDVVRFSYKCDHDNMVDQILGLERELKKSGYEITERDNKFLPTSNGGKRNYKAVHLQVKSPSGELFEVQIQSEETIKVKNKNHRHFEKQRKIDLKENPELRDEYDRLEKIMVDNVSEMREPPGILSLPTIKKKKNG